MASSGNSIRWALCFVIVGLLTASVALAQKHTPRPTPQPAQPPVKKTDLTDEQIQEQLTQEKYLSYTINARDTTSRLRPAETGDFDQLLALSKKQPAAVVVALKKAGWTIEGDARLKNKHKITLTYPRNKACKITLFFGDKGRGIFTYQSPYNSDDDEKMYYEAQNFFPVLTRGRPTFLRVTTKECLEAWSQPIGPDAAMLEMIERYTDAQGNIIRVEYSLSNIP